MSTKTVSKGPIYGVPLIGSLPLSGGMSQAMPSRADLLNVQRTASGGERTVAGYEVLLNSHQDLLAACKLTRKLSALYSLAEHPDEQGEAAMNEILEIHAAIETVIAKAEGA